MTLWNNIRNWFDNEKVEAASVPVEAQQSLSVAELFHQMCIEAGVHKNTLRKTNACQLFVEWYDGDGTRQCIADCFEKFKTQHPLIQKRFGGLQLK